MAVSDWNKTPLDNSTVGSINWAEGQNPNTVNDSARQMMAEVAGWVEYVPVFYSDTGAANAHVITPSPAITTYGEGQSFRFKVANANTGAVTVNVNGLGVKAIQKHGTALVSGDLLAGDIVDIVYDGTQFQLTSAARVPVGYTIGTNVQAFDDGLQSISGLTTAADRMIYTTAHDTYAVSVLTSFARTILDDSDADTARTTLGVGTGDSPSFTGLSISGGSGGQVMTLQPGSGDHVYIGFNARTATPATRSGFLGYSSAASVDMTFENQLAGNQVFRTNAANWLTGLSSGNVHMPNAVGIGDASSTHKLEVKGTSTNIAKLWRDSGAGWIEFFEGVTRKAYFGFEAGVGGSIVGDAESNAIVLRSTEGPVHICGNVTSVAQGLTVGSTEITLGQDTEIYGQLGIGAAPYGPLHIERAATGVTQYIKANTDAGAGNYAEIAFQLWAGADGTGTEFGNALQTGRPSVVIRAESEDNTARGAFVVGTFEGGANNSALTEKFRVASDGNATVAGDLDARTGFFRDSTGGRIVLDDSDVADASAPMKFITSDSGNMNFGTANRNASGGTTNSVTLMTLEAAGRINLYGNDLIDIGMVNLGSPTTLTISAGAITITKSYHRVDTESGAATDDLETINGGEDGDRLILYPANGGHTVVLKDTAPGGNLRLAGDFSMDSSDDTIELIYTGGMWRELSRSNNA